MERKLASIRKINSISPIEGADLIEKLTLGGWNVIAKKGEYQEGDLVIYCEIDSFLPIREEYNFLRKSSFATFNGKEGFRIKSMKLRGVISQGLVLPVSLLGDISVSEGDDVTETLGIEKYEKPIHESLAATVRGNFPSFLRKTDEERVQNFSHRKFNEILKLNEENQFVCTEKLDGTSVTFYLKDGYFGVCSRNYDLENTEGNFYWQVAKEYGIENILRDAGDNVAIQGEIIGTGIQGNKYKLNKKAFYAFSLYDIDTEKYVEYEDFIDFMTNNGIKTVPYIYSNMSKMVFNLPYTLNSDMTANTPTIEDLIAYADGYSLINQATIREGIVIRSKDRKVSFKVISNKFLLKNDE